MIHEHQLTVPVLEALDASLLGELTTTDLRREVKHRVKLDAGDLRPLRNRNDRVIDQIVRNIKCHRDVPGNAMFEGYVEHVPRGFRITKKGRDLLRRRRD